MLNYELFGRTLMHPLQRGVLTELEHAGPEMALSPVQVAQVLGIEASKVAYHFTVLAGQRQSMFKKTPLIELVAELPVRGAMEHFYVLTKNALVEDLVAA